MTLRLTEKQWRAICNGPIWQGDKDKCKRDLEARGHTVVTYDTPVKRAA